MVDIISFLTRSCFSDENSTITVADSQETDESFCNVNPNYRYWNIFMRYVLSAVAELFVFFFFRDDLLLKDSNKELKTRYFLYYKVIIYGHLITKG